VALMAPSAASAQVAERSVAEVTITSSDARWLAGADVAQARRRRACRPRGSETVVKSRTGRIYTRTRKQHVAGKGTRRVTTWYGCLYSRGQPYFLAGEFGASYDVRGINHTQTPRHEFRIAGRYAAFLEARASEGGPEGGSVVRRDLKTGAWRRDDQPSGMPGDAPDSPFVKDSADFVPTRLVLRNTGAVAWIVAPHDWSFDPYDPRCGARWPGPCRVLKRDRDGRVLLDEGSGVHPHSLALNGSTISWVNDRGQQTAVLR
jgi:hypothetical protein